ncbi:hypothetical protein XA68_18296 [Ophiocordyceps unilateralis]|uniref:F-box domain-containing protein n=1 Tax=Ophiocordyceps unilateralis TaxID=268505 RepID=A0A2A9P3N0_OPHUN|nr:hypothetical protein XA68_18296 [Ophiocordyceps unilateralis]
MPFLLRYRLAVAVAHPRLLFTASTAHPPPKTSSGMASSAFSLSDWALTQEAMLADVPAHSLARSASPPAAPISATSHHHHHQRFRSLSMSVPWRRSKPPFTLQHANDVAIDDSDELADGHGPGSSASLKGIFRRASLSFKGIVHRRSAHDAIHDKHASPARPTTAHATWSRLRQATSFRHARSVFGLDYPQEPSQPSQRLTTPNLPIPAMGSEPPIIPINTGAAAKASAAMQNDLFARQSMHNRWLHAPSSEDGNDRESGIGIAVTLPRLDLDEAADDGQGDVPLQDTSISRVDFVSMLPTELAIHVLAFLDIKALNKASGVSRSWNSVVQNQHVWRESCLRETTGSYATGSPIRPGTGLGLPHISPGKDWRSIYRAKHELSRRWKGGKARPIYLNGHMDSIYCLQFDEHKIISGSRDKTIRVWDMHTLECRLVIGPPEVVAGTSMLRDEDGNWTHFATGSDNVRTAHSMPGIVSFAEHHKASILCLQYDDEMLVTGSSDASCIVYDIRRGYRPMRRLRHHTAAVLDLVFDDKHIVTCSKDVSICVWDRETGELLRQLRGHAGPVNAVQMRGNTIVSCSGDFRVKLWNIDTGKNIREFVGHTKGLACSQFSEDGRYVASAGNDKAIRIWDANTGECVREMKAHDNLVRSLHIDSVSGRLISGSYDTDIKVWDMETGHQLLDFPRWHASWVLSAKSDYRRIVSTGQDPKILIMDFGAGVEGIELLESEGGSVDMAGRGFI